MTIEIVKESEWRYSILVDGEVVIECGSEAETKEFTIGDIIKLAK